MVTVVVEKIVVSSSSTTIRTMMNTVMTTMTMSMTLTISVLVLMPLLYLRSLLRYVGMVQYCIWWARWDGMWYRYIWRYSVIVAVAVAVACACAFAFFYSDKKWKMKTFVKLYTVELHVLLCSIFWFCFNHREDLPKHPVMEFH